MNEHPRNISIGTYSYHLPDERIARFPLEKRAQSKLLVYKNGAIHENVYDQLDKEIPANSLLVFNNTKVVEARLYFTKSTGSTIEIFCLEPAESYADITSAMLQQNRVVWKCLVGGAKKWKDEALVKELHYNGTQILFSAHKTENRNDYFLIEFSWSGNVSFAEILHLAGEIPLPPYLNRKTELSDNERYQTVYAAFEGSVAAPTAGLHFTPSLLKKLAEKNIRQQYLTLHVGAGTFKPVKADTMQQHEMHAEFFEVQHQLIEQLLQSRNEKIVAVGTTSLRTLESLYWLGVKLLSGKGFGSLQQWECYSLAQHFTVDDAMNALLDFMRKNHYEILYGKTQIIIAPGYQLKVAHGIVTNFHQPNSTLLLLVAAVVGEDWKKIYDYALQNNFRFLSYGDGSLLWNK